MWSFPKSSSLHNISIWNRTSETIWFQERTFSSANLEAYLHPYIFPSHLILFWQQIFWDAKWSLERSTLWNGVSMFSNCCWCIPSKHLLVHPVCDNQIRRVHQQHLFLRLDQLDSEVHLSDRVVLWCGKILVPSLFHLIIK